MHTTPLVSALAPDNVNGTVEEILRYDRRLLMCSKRFAYEDIEWAISTMSR